jgi:hypothetical protein
MPDGYARGVIPGHRSGITLAPNGAPWRPAPPGAVNVDHQRTTKRKVGEILAAEATLGEWAARMAIEVERGGWVSVVRRVASWRIESLSRVGPDPPERPQGCFTICAGM